MADTFRKGTGDFVAPVYARVVVEATGEFIVVGLSNDGDHTERVYGPSVVGRRKFEFMSGGEPLRVVCDSPKCEWKATVVPREERGDPVDPVPKEMPLNRRRPLSQQQLIRNELAAMLRMREEAGYATSFSEEDDFDIEDLENASDPVSEYEVRELEFDEDLEGQGVNDGGYTASIEEAERSAREQARGRSAGSVARAGESPAAEDQESDGAEEGAPQPAPAPAQASAPRRSVRAGSRPLVGKAR